MSIPNACFGRADAIDLAIRTALFSHLVVAVLTLALLACLKSGAGILAGLGVAALMTSTIPFIVLPAATAIGYLTHLLFQQTQVSIHKLIIVLSILFEVTFFGWVVWIILMVFDLVTFS